MGERHARLSPSGVASFLHCPAEWFDLYLCDYPRPPATEAMIRGTFVHRVLELLMQYSPRDRSLGIAKVCAVDAWTEMADEIDLCFGPLDDDALATARHEFRWAAWERIERFFTLTDPTGTDVWACEFDLDLEVDGVPFVGHIDLVEDRTLGLQVWDYKGLALDTPLPTPQGWVTMGEVAVGDHLMGANGLPTEVVAKSEVHHHPCFEVVFDDGSTIVADHEHRWMVHRDTGPKLMTTAEMKDDLFSGRARPQRDCRIPNASPLNLQEVDLPVDPWMLGYWLGNGNRTSGSICWGNESVPAVVVDRGFRLGEVQHREGSKAKNATVLSLVGLLKSAGVIRNKHVPPLYLRGSIQQRLLLLQGLMDSDGSWNATRDQAVFVNLDRGLAEAVYELAVSLGQHASWWEGAGSGFGKTVHQYRVSFTPLHFTPFLTAKGAEVCLGGASKTRRRLVREVRPIEMVPTQCVSVDAEDHLYLCGPQMVPTHNSANKPEPGRFAADKEAVYLLQPRLYGAALRELGHRVQKVGLWFLGDRPGELSLRVDDAALDRTVTTLRTVWANSRRVITAGKRPEGHTGPLCGWCEMLEHCPEGQREVRVRISMGRNVGPGAAVV